MSRQNWSGRAVASVVIIVIAVACVRPGAVAAGATVSLSDVSGTARIYGVNSPDFGNSSDIRASAPLSFPDSGTLQKQWATGGGGSLTWSFSRAASSADLLVDLTAQADNGFPNGGSEVVLKFVTSEPLSYHLHAHAPDAILTGRGVGAAIDQKQLLMHFPYDSPIVDTLDAVGTLGPGTHTFAARGESDIFRLDAHLDVVAEVTLQLRPQGATAIPLPPAVWPGSCLLAGGAIALQRRARCC